MTNRTKTALGRAMDEDLIWKWHCWGWTVDKIFESGNSVFNVQWTPKKIIDFIKKIEAL